MADQMTGPDALRYFHTGAASAGGSQANPNLSLGLHRAGDEIEMVDASRTSPIANITLDYVSGMNADGNGTLTASSASGLKWTPPGGVQGSEVTIANGETKIIQGGSGYTDAYVRVTRTSATALTGTETVAISGQPNNAVGFDDVSAAEATAGDSEYRCVGIKNVSSSTIKSVKAYIDTIGTARVTAAGQLGASGAGTISISSGTFDDWPTSGYARIETNVPALREIVYYESRTSTSLTVPANGRQLLGTTNAAGAATDTAYSVPGIGVAKEAPTSQPSGTVTDKTVAGEGSAPALTFNTAITAADGESIGDLAAGEWYGVWIKRQVPAGAVGRPAFVHEIRLAFESA